MMGELQDIRVERPTRNAAVVEFTGEHDLAQADRIQSLFESLVEQNAVVVADFSEAQRPSSTSWLAHGRPSCRWIRST